MKYQISNGDSGQTLTVVAVGEPHTITESHPRFKEVRAYLLDGGTDEQEVRGMLDITAHLTDALAALSERVGITADGQITYDGDRLDTTLSRHLARIMRDGSEGYAPWVRFLDNLATNPSPESRRHLYRWLRERDFTITEDGCFVGYKGVTAEGRSHSRGNEPVLVDGVEHIGAIPYPVGATVVMPRALVDASRDSSCSVGLHVGTHEYALGYTYGGGRLLTVVVNPRDVVAVPRGESQKMRVCRLKVERVSDVLITSPVVAFEDDDDDEFEVDEFEEPSTDDLAA